MARDPPPESASASLPSAGSVRRSAMLHLAFAGRQGLPADPDPGHRRPADRHYIGRPSRIEVCPQIIEHFLIVVARRYLRMIGMAMPFTDIADDAGRPGAMRTARGARSAKSPGTLPVPTGRGRTFSD